MSTVRRAGIGEIAAAQAAGHSNGRINTKTARRRLVSYSCLADLARDLDRIEAAHRAGTLRKLGNHEPGAIFAHTALAMKCSFDGFPAMGSLWIRSWARLLKRRILSRPFRPGLKLSRGDEQAAWESGVGFEDGLNRLREQIGRAARPDARPCAPHPFFGPMSTDDWRLYQLRHAELHMSFLRI